MSLESLDRVHERGGDCDKQRDKFWKAIHNLEDTVVEERIEAVRLSTKIAIYTGLICGLPALALVVIEVVKLCKGG